jgi:peroxiredoxin
MITLKNRFFSLVLVAVVVALAAANPFSLGAADTAATQKSFDFTLKDYHGKTFSLEDFRDAEAVVVIYVATRCPVSNAYNKRMASLYRDFKDKHIAFLGINSNKAEDVAEIKEHAQKNGLDFPILKDLNNVVADRYQASVTPEVYVLNSGKKLLYHGRIDDSRREDQVTSRDLRNALTEILAGKEAAVKETKAFGCTIKRVEKG